MERNPRLDSRSRVSHWGSAVREFAPWRRVWVEIGIAALVGLTSVILGVIALGVSFRSLTERWTTGGPDQVLHYLIFTSATQVSPFLPNDRLGFPEAQNLFFAPLFDPWSALFVRILGGFGANGILALNLYNILSFFAVGLTAYAFLRALGVRRIVSVVLGVLVSAAPFHFYQIAIGHPFIANYWAVPLIGILTFMVAGPRTNPFESWSTSAKTRAMYLVRRIVPIVALAFLVGLTQSYYYVFGAIVVGGVWLLSAVRSVIVSRSFRRLAWPTITVGALLLVIGAQLAILSLNWGDRYEKYFAGRTPAESELYGGKIANLLLPAPGSGIPFLGRLARVYQAGSPTLVTSEVPWTAVIASVGMVAIVLAILLRLLARPRTLEEGTPISRFIADDRIGVVSAGFLWALFFFLSAGLGTMFAYVVSPEIRAWSRMSVVISLFAVAFVALAIQRFARGRIALTVTLVIVAVVGLVDQIPGMPQSLPIAASADTSIRDYSAQVEKILDPECGVVELPLKGFPETGDIGKMGAYDEGLPYIYAPTHSLRWSYGAVLGTHSGDFWSHATTPGSFASAVHSSGACAVQVDTTAYSSPDGWRPFVGAIGDPDTPVLTSAGTPGRYLLFKVSR